MAHTKRFFEDYSAPSAPQHDLADLAQAVAGGDEQLRDYFCYVLLDLVTTDPDLEEAPLAAALLLARELDVQQRFMEVATTELRLRKRQIESVCNEAEKIVARAGKVSDT